ncbi:MAG TPA: sodium:solute symporter [Verrucomicrobia bacterium]|nr:MAG: sodium:solute symporter [Lentisphaerae bacterium GWF2_57_35]HBA84804.1 sodium:solute symporter [Verrucomicrobiota bacterium]
MDSLWMTITVIVYLFAVGYLGYRGYRATHSATDYLIAGRKTHPYVMAISYGATFISTSAIVGFGGAAGVFGMGLLWLTVLNIFFGIFIAFVLFGGRTRSIGLRLDAHTFPELLGRRFKSRFLQGSSALIIFLFMPLYASAVLIGAAKFIAEQLGIPYEAALFVFSVVVALYVIMGGIKGVMYTDALQGTIMLVGMIALIALTYHSLGGIAPAHEALTRLVEQVPDKLKAGGHLGWTSMPKFGSPLWWTLVSTIVMGVGVGVLAQPQLAVRYMTVKSGRELNRAVPIGGVFILMMTGVAFVVGALTNVYFFNSVGKIAIGAAAGDVEKIIPMYIKGAMPAWFGLLFMLTLLSAAMSTVSSQIHVMGTSLGRDLVEQAFRAKKAGSGMLATRLGVLIGILVSVYLGYELEKRFGKTGTEIVARGTAVFFGLCACAFLPMYAGALWSRAITRAGAIAGMLTGACSSMLWMLFVHEKESTALLLCKTLFGVRSLGIKLVEGKEVFVHAGPMVWAFVDPLVIGLPLAMLVTVLVSMFTRKLSEDHLKRCFG